MIKDEYLEMFAKGKTAMRLDQAADYIHTMLDEYFPMLPKAGIFNHEEYIRRLACRTACMEIEEACRSASPWEDYREIIADFEWPYMRRAAAHFMEDIHDKRLGKADAWIVEMWVAYHIVYLRMPGAIPNSTAWRMHDSLMSTVLNKSKKYRRML